MRREGEGGDRYNYQGPHRVGDAQPTTTAMRIFNSLSSPGACYIKYVTPTWVSIVYQQNTSRSLSCPRPPPRLNGPVSRPLSSRLRPRPVAAVSAC